MGNQNTVETLTSRIRELEHRISELSVTDHDQALRESNAFMTAAKAILTYRNFNDSARAIFDACTGLIGATSGYIALLNSDGSENEVLFLEAGDLPCTVDPELPMPIRGLRAESYKSGSVVYDNDFMESRWMQFMPEGHVRLDNVMFAPLNIEGKTVGIMGIANKPGGFTEKDAGIASAFGDLAAIALNNSRMLDDLIHSEERYRAVSDSAVEAIVTFDDNGTILSWNEAFEKLVRYDADEIPEISLTGLFDCGEDAFNREKHIGKTVELTVLTKDSAKIPVELSLGTWKSREGVFYSCIIRDISERKKIQAERERLIEDLRQALNEVKNLKGLIPICSHCKKIRNDKGYWEQVEIYIRNRSDAEFSHGICPECITRYYPDIEDEL